MVLLLILKMDRLPALAERGVTSSLAPVIPWIVAMPELVSVAGSHKLGRG